MKKIAKIILTIFLSLTVISIPNDFYRVAARTFGDYSYTILKDGTVEISNYGGDAEILEIPSEIEGMSVTSIGYGAFAECKSIVKLVIPETVKTLDVWTFSKCTRLEEVTLPENLLSLGKNAFSGCSSLKTINLPKNLKNIGYGTFYDCINLESIVIPEGIESIDGMAFGNCKSLSSIKLPDSLTNIGGSAFTDCIELREIDITKNVKTIGTSAFAGCINLSDVKLPEGLTGIGQSAFKDNINIVSIHLPESLEAIGYSAFSGCTSLKDINIPSKITKIGNATFSGCSGLEEIEIPETVEEIGEYAFSGCVSLKSLSIPDSVKDIGAFAFSFCSDLKEIHLSNRLTEINTGLFTDCFNLESVILPNSVEKVGDTVFSGCTNLRSVILPDGIVELGSRVFSNADKVTVSVFSGSEAYLYAVRNNVAYRIMERGINLNVTNMKLNLNESELLSVVQYPYTILDNKDLTWSSSNPAIATVDADGVVQAKSEGTAKIIVETKSGMKSEATVLVENVKNPITNVSLNYDKMTIKKGTAEGLRATITPLNPTDSKLLTWTSSDTSIATVTSTGVVTGRNVGTAVITVTTSNGLKASTTVTITSEIKDVNLNKTALVLDEGTTQTLRATINPSDTTDSKALRWVSSNTNVATVDENGSVKAIHKGTATITVYTVNNRSASCKIQVNEKLDIEITGVEVDKSKLTMAEGEKALITATILPADTTMDRTLTWKSEHPEIASVDERGEISAKAEGKTTITVTTSNGKKANVVVTVVKKEVPITSVELNKEQVTIDEGATEALKATINPSNTTMDKTLSWKSDDETIATVDANGVIHAVKAGKTTIHVETINGMKDSVEVIVQKKVIPLESITLDQTQVQLEEKGSVKLTATVSPADTTMDTTLTWKSDHPEVASVDAQGNITATKAGRATITVTSKNGVSATCQITVVESVQKVTLRDTIATMENVDLSKYEKEEQAAFKEALKSAVAVYEDETSTSDDYAAATLQLNEAYQALVKIPLLTSHLEISLTFSKKAVENKAYYIQNQAWTDFVAAYEQAKVAMTSDEQEDIDKAFENLCDAYMEIRLIPDSSVLGKL